MLGFFYALQEAGIPVSVRYVLEFYRALGRGTVSDMDGLFLLARLVFVKRVEHYDAFEQVFASYFFGAAGGREMPDWEEMLAGKPFQEWLREQLEKGVFSADELREFDSEELLARFRETILAQKGEHHGGSAWTGSKGTSPFGHGGRAGGGIRVYGRSFHGTALKAVEERRYLNYSGKAPMRNENLGQVLATLKSLQPTGPETDLDVDETIARTAGNGGEIELVFRRELRNRLKLVVLLDNGGYSMEPYYLPVKTVFSRIRDSFEDVRFYYFHNCVYGTAYRDPPRMRPTPWETLVNQGKNTRLVIIGDANMAPAELMAANGSMVIGNTERKPGIEWLKELRAAYPASVWLNPIKKELWDRESSTIRRIGLIFHMEDLTIDGIRNAVAYLNSGDGRTSL